MHQREPVDIMNAHLPGVGIVRGEENQSDGGSPSGADCAVQGVLVMKTCILKVPYFRQGVKGAY